MGGVNGQEKGAEERDRYRLAWLSARRRAARETEFAAEALALKDAEIRRLTADLRKLTCAPNPLSQTPTVSP